MEVLQAAFPGWEFPPCGLGEKRRDTRGEPLVARRSQVARPEAANELLIRFLWICERREDGLQIRLVGPDDERVLVTASELRRDHVGS